MSTSLPLRVDPDSPLPLAAQLSRQLTWLIIGGVLQEGDRLPSIAALAEDLGINLHTVRSAYLQLEARNLVSLARGRRARVLAYDRTTLHEPPSAAPSHTIGIIIPAFVQFYAPLLAAIEAEAAQEPALVFVANAREDPDTALAYLDRLIARGVDGVIVAKTLPGPGLDLPGDGWPPIVFFDIPGSPGTSIEFDLAKSQYLATRHLIEHGHRRIGYIIPPLGFPNVEPKLRGHRKALKEAGIEADDRLTVEIDGFTLPASRRAADHLLEISDPPSAITTASDGLAVGVYQSARFHGVRVPDDLAVTSNDDSEFSTVVAPELTTVSLPIAEAGRLAVQSIQRIRAGEPGPGRVVFDVDLVVRGSCGCSRD